MKLLVIEDSPRLRQSLLTGLTKLGFVVDAAEDGREGLAFARLRCYDVIILDLMLPHLDGLSLLEQLKNTGDSRAGVLILSAKGELEDRVLGLNSGADDYLCKPFEFAELIARINSVARKSLRLSGNSIGVGDLSLDTALMRVSAGDRGLPLTPLEYLLLEYLFLHRGRVATYENLENHVFNHQKMTGKNSIEVHISSLRKKIREAGSAVAIKTRRGFGYYLEQP